MIEITPLTSSEIDAIVPIENACHSHPSSANVLASCFSKRYHNFKMSLNGEVIGFYFADFVVDEMTLQDICIIPSAQGQGLGKQLFHHFLATAKKLNVVQLWLEVRESNTAAIALYENHDFIVTDKRRNYYPTANGREDALLMGCSLMF